MLYLECLVCIQGTLLPIQPPAIMCGSNEMTAQIIVSATHMWELDRVLEPYLAPGLAPDDVGFWKECQRRIKEIFFLSAFTMLSVNKH